MREKAERKKPIHEKMKTLRDILSEVQALATVTEDQFEAALTACVADLQAMVDGATGTAPAADPVATVVVTTVGGTVTTCVPQS